MRTAVYIDGYNLFYGILKGTKYKWLDVLALSQNLLPKDYEIVSINYYTAMVKGASDKLVKQEAYLRALRAHIPVFRSKLGKHQIVTKMMPLAEPVSQNSKGHIKYERGKQVLVIKTEEKKSDVNIAVDIVNDSWLDVYDCALLISNDSDLASPLLVAKGKDKIIGLATTTAQPCSGLRKIPHFHRHITNNIIKKSQLPDEVEKPESYPKVTYMKPTDW